MEYLLLLYFFVALVVTNVGSVISKEALREANNN
jgi:hypothetical protein